MAVTKNKKVAYFGIPGSYTHAAATVYFPSQAELLSSTTFRDVFSQVKNGDADQGIVPIENTLAGSVYENYDLLDEFDLTIVGEITSRVEHSLLVSKSYNSKAPKQHDYKNIVAVYSHPKALEQCSIFLNEHPWIEKRSCSDTANAARLVHERNDPTIAAIASGKNADIYDLAIVQDNLENNAYNYTRFLIISKPDKNISPDNNKCSLLVQLPHVTGSLSKALGFLPEQGCNLTKIESRPMQLKPFEYVFYLDFLFDESDREINDIITDFKKQVVYLKLLGIYKDERVQNQNFV